MWPSGSTQQQLYRIDERLARVSEALNDARGHGNDELLDDLIARYDELLDDRLRIEAMLPKPRRAAD